MPRRQAEVAILSPVSSWWLFGVACHLLVACDAGAPRQVYACRCDYVTDMDVPGQLLVDVCAASQPKAEDEAVECSTAMGVGHAERCVCAISNEACAASLCQQTAARLP